MDEKEVYQMVTMQQASRTSPPLSIINVMHQVQALTTKTERLLTQPILTTMRLHAVVDHEGFPVHQEEVSIIREGGGTFLHSNVEGADAEDIGDVGGEVLKVHILLYHRCRCRSVAIRFMG